MSMPTVEEIKNTFKYDPHTGALTYKETGENATVKDKRTKNPKEKCYWMVTYQGRIYAAARVAHVLMNGEWPAGKTRYLDEDPLNIKWVNLEFITPRPITLDTAHGAGYRRALLRLTDSEPQTVAERLARLASQQDDPLNFLNKMAKSERVPPWVRGLAQELAK